MTDETFHIADPVLKDEASRKILLASYELGRVSEKVENALKICNENSHDIEKLNESINDLKKEFQELRNFQVRTKAAIVTGVTIVFSLLIIMLMLSYIYKDEVKSIAKTIYYTLQEKK